LESHRVRISLGLLRPIKHKEQKHDGEKVSDPHKQWRTYSERRTALLRMAGAHSASDDRCGRIGGVEPVWSMGVQPQP
jgi:hypothetical protein